MHWSGQSPSIYADVLAKINFGSGYIFNSINPIIYSGSDVFYLVYVISALEVLGISVWCYSMSLNSKEGSQEKSKLLSPLWQNGPKSNVHTIKRNKNYK